MAPGPDTKFSRYGGWLPSRPVHRAFVGRLVKSALSAPIPGGPTSHRDDVQEFANTINADRVMRGLFDNIFLQADPKEAQVKSFDVFINMLDGIVGSAPPFVPLLDEHGVEIGEPVGVPIYLVLDVLSNTSAAYDLFRMEAFNKAFKKLLNSWSGYLAKDGSNTTLNEGETGWFSQPAIQKLQKNLDGHTFEETYVCPDPRAPDRGFKSWDAFFVRLFQDGQRPIIPLPDDQKGTGTLIYNACESTVYYHGENVKAHDRFWLKGKQYSLYDILNRDKNDTALFENGTVYQAFLSPLDYHRWHSPVTGTIKKVVRLDGTYYAALPDFGAEKGDPDLKEGDPRGAIIRSQAWLNVAAARALIFIQADSDDIGLMCFVGMGMVEVSSCDVTVKEGDRVSAGDQIGMFHFGGSTHTLIFGPQTKVTFENDVVVDTHLKINRIIGKAVRNKTGGSSQ